MEERTAMNLLRASAAWWPDSHCSARTGCQRRATTQRWRRLRVAVCLTVMTWMAGATRSYAAPLIVSPNSSAQALVAALIGGSNITVVGGSEVYTGAGS